MPLVAFVPSTPAPTHPGRFLQPVQVPPAAVTIGVPFLPDQLGPQARLAVEAAFGSGPLTADNLMVWTDISARVLRSTGVLCSPGQADESSAPQSVTVACALKNQDGALSADNPTSPYHPYVRQGTPIRVRLSLDGGRTWSVRGFAYALGWAPSWDSSGQYATVRLRARGTLQRLAQGTAPVRSPMTRQISQNPTSKLALPVAHWPMEDASGSTGFAEFSGGRSAVPFGTVSFAADATSPATAPLPTFAAGAGVTGVLPAYPVNAGWQAEFMIRMPALPAGDTVLLSWQTLGDAQLWKVIYNGTSKTLRVAAYNAAGSERLADSGIDMTTLGTYLLSQVGLFHVAVQQIGGGQARIETFLYFKNPATGTLQGNGSDLTATISVGVIKAWSFTASAALAGVTFGQVAFYGAANYFPDTDGFFDADYTALAGHGGELSLARMQRLAFEEGSQARLLLNGQFDAGTALAAQPIDTLISILGRTVRADTGSILWDGLPGSGMFFRPRESRWSQTAKLTLDMSAYDLVTPFDPADDDQQTRNQFTVTRTGGSSGQVTQPDGPRGTALAGPYASSDTLDLWQDQQVRDHAAMRVALGTVPGLRYPTISFDLARPEHTDADRAAWCTMLPGSKLVVTGARAAYPQHPPGDIEAQAVGWTEQFWPTWQVTANTVSDRPWQVWALEDPVYPFRLDTDGCVTVADVSATATSWLVNPTSAGKPLLSTLPADYPCDLDFEGERITVTSVTGTVAPQTMTATRSVNGISKSHQAGAALSLWHPPTLSF